MAKKPSAIVIGAGIGGIATAGRLARNGYEVTVVEKTRTAGGRCDQIVKDGHRFDVGPTLFLMPEVFEETYAAFGEKMSDHLDLKRIDPTYTVRFDDGTSLATHVQPRRLQTQLEAIEPGAFGGFLRYLSEGQQNYRLSLQKFVGRNFYNYFQYFSPANLPLLFKLKALVKHYDNVGHYFKDPHLKAAFTFQNMYLGLSPVRCARDVFAVAVHRIGRRHLVSDGRPVSRHRVADGALPSASACALSTTRLSSASSTMASVPPASC